VYVHTLGLELLAPNVFLGSFSLMVGARRPVLHARACKRRAKPAQGLEPATRSRFRVFFGFLCCFPLLNLPTHSSSYSFLFSISVATTPLTFFPSVLEPNVSATKDMEDLTVQTPSSPRRWEDL